MAAVLVGFIATPNTAEANGHLRIGSSHSYVSGRASCGCPIYTKRTFRGFNSYRRPIYNYYRQPFRCSCRSSHRSSIVRHGHNTRFVSPRFSRGSGRSHFSRNSHFRGRSNFSHSRGRSSGRS